MALTKREAVIISAYTGFSMGVHSEMREYVEGKLGPLFTHEYADPAVIEKIREAVKPDFLQICKEVV